MRKILRRFWARRFWRFVVIGGLAFMLFNVAAVFLTSQNWFCGTCHIMKTYHASWEASEHEDVDCVQCHVSPGLDNLVAAKINGFGQFIDDLLGRASGKPTASVSDFSCMRSDCHDLKELQALPKNRGKYLFDHDKHLDLEHYGIKTHCTTCHSHIKGDTHFEVNTNVCIGCHLIPNGDRLDPEMTRLVGGTGVSATADVQPAVASEGAAAAPKVANESAAKVAPTQCKKCHEPPAEPLEYHGVKVVHREYVEFGASCEGCHHNATEKPAKVNDAQCFSCHDFGREKQTDVVELHRQHFGGEHKVECFRCHGVIRHGSAAEAMRLQFIDCRSCHQNQHNIQSKTYKISGPLPSTQMAASHATSQPASHAVTPMFLTHVDCTGCHVKPKPVPSKPDSGARVAVATAEACDRCHQPGLGTQMIPMWQKTTKNLYRVVSELVSSADDVKDPRMKQRLDDARKLLEVIRLDGSWGVHNPLYTQKLLRDARDQLSQAKAAATKKAGGSP